MVVKDGKIGFARFFDKESRMIAILAQYNLEFEEEWTMTLGDITPGKPLSGLAFAEALDNGFFITGRVPGNFGTDIEVQKTDSTGIVIWETTFGNTWINEAVWAITAAEDGGCVVVYNIDNFERRVQKISSQGDLEWDFYINEGSISFFNFGNIVTGANGNFYYTGLFRKFAIEEAFVICFSQTG